MTELAVRDDEAGELDLVERARNLLVQATSVDEVKGIRDKAEALRAYAKQAGLGLDAQNRAAEVKLRAERRAGELLAADPDVQEFRPVRGNTMSPLTRYGIEKHESSRWQRVASLPAETFENYIEAALLGRKEVTTAGALKLAKQHRDPGTGEVEPLPDGVFRTITADPPWQYDNRSTRGAAEDHYGTLSIAQLTGADPLPDGTNLAEQVRARAADEGHLYLWSTAGHLPEAFAVMEAWGFTYKTYIVWVKPQMGMGNYFRVSTEIVLFGAKQTLRTNDRGLKNYFQAPRAKHSAKPREFRELVKRASSGPYLEMFARCRRDELLAGCECSRCEDGWEVWGNET